MSTMTDRLAALDRAIAEGRILRGAWRRTDADGREMVCLLTALSPEAGDAEDAGACPGDVMPLWLAQLTPWMDDAGSLDAWPWVVCRYAALAHRWHVLDAAAWRRLDLSARSVAVVEAMAHIPEGESWGVRAACEGVLAWLDDGAPEARRVAVKNAADSAADAAAAAWAARDAADTAEWADVAAARAAKASAAEASAAVSAARWAAARAAGLTATAAATWDRMVTAILDAIEAECDRAEVAA